ncbi:urease accessory protein UreD [Sporosarcina sp. BI001-red]|uniref:urease accessory protein UreD n=1 Tax=Sporosarcina sp. BI001-red TaxID=2282866 RepID=UPI000E25D74F|nr:urease accessory protein UreD [Sporosarcina sp. BI001-red]REB06097.1 urease accessory protein UreD [Sporosarcina sp. BI001-red]
MSDWTGILELDAQKNQYGKTITKNVFFQGAFKVMRPVYHNRSNQPCYYLLNPGGGYLDGDTYRMRITVGEQAMVTLTTQSATKVYRTPTKHAYQEAEIFLQVGSHLQYLPDPLIAYKGASYYQKTIFRMDKGASLLYTDILTPGWSPDGEAFSYDSIRLKTEVYLENELIVFDHIHLNPHEKPMDSIGVMEGYTHLGSFLIVSEQSDVELEEKLVEVINDQSGKFKVGISQLAKAGLSIRVMANTTQLIERIFADCHSLVNKEWFGTEPNPLRKY